jgi:Zn-dependent protease
MINSFMGGSEIIAQLLVYMVVLLFAVSAHEAAHAWMSYKFGDDTARLLGRVTLNPVAHTDPLGTLVLPIASFLLSAMGGALASIPLIGWGKPTPINPLLWRKKDLANVMVSAAGIMANILIAITFLIVFKILLRTSLLYQGGSLESVAEPIELFLRYTIYMNASLAVFNLLPFPPLDGSKILETFLPSSMQPVWDMLEQFGFIILMAIIYFGILRAIFAPIRRFIDFLIWV